MNILEIAKELGLEYKKKGLGKSLYYVCPLCDDENGHMNLEYEKNVWRCNKCGASGGALHLVVKVLNCDVDTAKKWLSAKGCGYKNYVKKPETTYIEDPKTDINKLDLTYRHLVKIMPLYSRHKNELLKRGLTEKEIKRMGFVSLPLNRDDTTVAKKMIEDGFDIHGIPGFFTKGKYESWYMNSYPTGYLIPYINIDGKVSGFQIRSDKPDDKIGKYSSFSSTRMKNGTKSQIDVHFIGYTGQKTLLLTEGALKADIAHQLMRKRYGKNYAIAAIPGVNNTKNLFNIIPKLKELGVEKIVDCFDMDKAGNNSVDANENVVKAIDKIKKKFTSEGFNWTSMIWPYEKGIDDYLYSNHEEYGVEKE